MDGAAVPEAINNTDPGRAKILQVFQYLRALNDHRNPATQQLKDQLWSLRLRGVPSHPCVFAATADGNGTGAGESDGAILRVSRPARTPAPAPPPSIREWLEPNWSEPLKAVEYRPSRNEIAEDGSTIVVRFEASPERVQSFNSWNKTRDEWVTNEVPTLKALRLFEQLYELHGRIEREAERVELILGDGHLGWGQGAVSIHHPVLLQRVQLQFDPSVPQFTVADTGGVADLYTAVLHGIDEIDGKTLARCRAELAEGGFLPLGGDDTAGFLRRFGNVLSPSTIFEDSVPPQAVTATPRIGRDPVLFLRTRNLGFASALDGILADLPQRDDLPVSLLRIVGTDAGPAEGATVDAPVELWSEPESVLLSKPANPEQIQIAQRLDRFGCVLVQGPPGTGKTHTIANLIGHLLAQGKSVLVTSHTTKALRVLREKVVEALMPLCVSVLDNDLDSRSQLEGAVTAIAERLSSSDAQVLEREAAELQKARHVLLGEILSTRTALLEAQADEYRDVVVGGQSWTPSNAARRVAAEAQEHSWVPTPVTLGAPCPLSQGEAFDLYGSNALVTADQETELGTPLPEPTEILAPQVAAECFERLKSLDEAEDGYQKDLWPTPKPEDDEQELASVCGRALKAVEALDPACPWKLEVVGAGAGDSNEVGVWRSLLEMVRHLRKKASAARELLLKHDPVVELEEEAEPWDAVAAEIRIHLEAGKSLSVLTLMMNGAWRRLLKSSRVAEGEPRTAEHLAAIEAQLQLRKLRRELCGRWDRQMAVHGAPSSVKLGVKPEEGSSQFVAEIERSLTWAHEVWRPLQTEVEKLGLQWQALLDRQAPVLEQYGELLRLRATVTGPFRTEMQARARAVAKVRIESDLASAVLVLDKWGGPSATSPTVRELVRSLKARDATAYSTAFSRLVDLVGRRAVLERRRQLLAKVEQVARPWAALLRERRSVHGAATPPGDVEAAWTWRQLHDELARRGRVELSTLQNVLEAKSADLRRVTADLIERSAWAAQLRRTNLPQRQALEGWLQTIRKIGKGTGKRVPRLRAEAAQKMSECKDAVPVWVMPLAQVVDNFGAKTRFDCVIIDEASQSDVLALAAMYMAKSVVVVGDHEQVSPSAIGQNLGIVQQLIDEHLQGVPNSVVYDGTTSVYDIAKSSFGGVVCLTEHFRCVPEIIEFSNQLSYEGRIKPLRESGSSTLKPGLVLHRVPGHSNHKINPHEAQAVAALLAAAVEHEAYRDKTFGVISLVGEEQALEIERILRERLPPAEFERRRILCGNAAQFQGDERDVMFLSMVDSPQGGPLTLRANSVFKQRFNVAASRAKDQLWVVHSLNPEIDLKADDLRRRLIEHCKSPFGLSAEMRKAAVLVESPFEREVLERLVRAGYRVTPQWEVGHFRIDLVVEGGGRRLAIECDGDRYHPHSKLQEDMARQAILERLGWRFARIRGSAFFRDPERAMAPVFARLRELDVTPDRDLVVDAPAETSGLYGDLVRRSAELARTWATDPTEGGDVGGGSGAVAQVTPEPKATPKRPGGSGWARAAGDGAQAAGAKAAVPAEPLNSARETSLPAQAVLLPTIVPAEVPAAGGSAGMRLEAGRSKEVVKRAILQVSGAVGQECDTCRGARSIQMAKEGPVFLCGNRGCAKREAVAPALLSEALRLLRAMCDCGEPLKVARGYGGSTFIGCSNYPTHRRSISWKDL